MLDIDRLSADERATHKVYVQGGMEGDKESEDAAGFVVVGPHSAEFRKAQAKLGAKVIALMRANEAKDAEAKKAGEDKPEVEPPKSDEDVWSSNNEAIRQRARIVAECCVIDVFGFSSAGAAVPFSAELLSQLLTARPMWAFMIMRAVENEANFTKA